MRWSEFLTGRKSVSTSPRLGLDLNSPAALRAGCWLHARLGSIKGLRVAPGRLSVGGHPFHSGVAAAPDASVASLLTRHFLRDGEVILLIIKPSLWYVTLSSIRFAAAVLIAVIGAHLWMHSQYRFVLEAGVFVIAGRVMWALLSWMGRLYVLTDQRVVRISGVVSTEIFECPLRRVVRTRVAISFWERFLGVGSIEIIPQEEDRPCGYWNTLKAPIEVNHQIVAAIKRARSSQGACGAA